MYQLTILFTNDHHGHFWTNKRGEGGMAAQYTVIQSIRQQVEAAGGAVLLLSCGDINTGSPESDLDRARPDFLGMKYMGYQAMAVGNHEFDNPLEVLYEQQTWVDFPFLSANLFFKGSELRPFQPYIIKAIQGLRVGIVGLTTEDSNVMSINFPHEVLELRPVIAVMQTLIPTLKAQVDIVIVLGHLDYHPPDGKHDYADVITLAKAVPDIDIILGGHTHHVLSTPDIQGSTIIAQAGENSYYLGQIDLSYHNHKIKLENYCLHTINYKKQPQPFIEEDIGLKTLLESFQVASKRRLSQEIGYAVKKFEGHRGVIRYEQTNLGRFVLYLMKYATGADAAIISSGLIRSSLSKGVIILRDVHRIHPFQLPYCTVTLTGVELKAYVLQVAQFAPGTGKYPQMSHFQVECGHNDNVQVSLRHPAALEPIVDDRYYTLALTKFNATGGDEYPVMVHHPTFKETEFIDTKTMEQYFRKHQYVNPDDFNYTQYG